LTEIENVIKVEKAIEVEKIVNQVRNVLTVTQCVSFRAKKNKDRANTEVM